MRFPVLITCFALSGLACGESGSGAPSRYTGPGQTVKVMTRNVFLGTDFDSALNVPKPELIPAAVQSIWEHVQMSDFPGRAQLIAQEVAAALPDIVAFQELEWFRMQSPSDFEAGAAPNAVTSAPNGDMLTIMKDALAAAGLDYELVVVATHSDTELPGQDAQGTYDLRMTDRDAVFVRAGVQVSGSRTEEFTHLVTVPVGGVGNGIFINLSRGLAAVDVAVQGVPFTFVATHLEIGGTLSLFQEAQAEELIERLSPLAGQVVLAGDFNSAADGSTTHSYKTVTAAFRDLWADVNAADPGPTCCTEIQNPAAPAPQTRIDLILGRGKVRAESAMRTGTDGQHTQSGLLPSDHLGVAATLTIGS